MVLGLRIQETPPQAKNTAEFSDARSRRWWPCVLFQASEPHFRSPFPVIGEGFAHPGAFAPSTTCERKAQINSSRCRFGRSSLSRPLRQRIFSLLCTVCAGSVGSEKAVFSVCCVPCVLARRELRKPSADAAVGEEAVEVQKKNVGLVDKK